MCMMIEMDVVLEKGKLVMVFCGYPQEFVCFAKRLCGCIIKFGCKFVKYIASKKLDFCV
jgi:hypothetical protein